MTFSSRIKRELRVYIKEVVTSQLHVKCYLYEQFPVQIDRTQRNNYLSPQSPDINLFDYYQIGVIEIYRSHNVS